MTVPPEPYQRIVITRPEAQGRVFAAFAAKRAAVAVNDLFVFLPLMAIDAVAFSPPDPSSFSGVIFSSSNGVRFFAEQAGASFRPLPVYAVGPGTAQQAAASGFHNVEAVARDARALQGLMTGLMVPPGSKTRLLFVRGEDVHTDFAAVLDPSLFEVQPLTVYRARAIAWTEREAGAVLRGLPIGGVTFFSERTARLFIRNAQEAPALLNLKKAEALCISNEVLEAVRPFWDGPLHAASSPDQEGMADLVLSRLRGQAPKG